MLRFLFTLVFGFWSLILLAQKFETHENDFNKDVIMSDGIKDSSNILINHSPVLADLSGALGFGGVGLVAALNFNLDVLNFLGTYRYYTQGLTSYQSINERSVLLGYRIGDRKHTWSFEAGYGSVSYKCTSGLNFDCYTYVEETMPVFPFYVEYDFYQRKLMGMGLAVNMSFSKREDSASIMYILKFGYLNGKRN